MQMKSCFFLYVLGIPIRLFWVNRLYSVTYIFVM